MKELMELFRIANALERIAAALEEESNDEVEKDSLEDLRMHISVDAIELANAIIKRHPNRKDRTHED